MARIRASIIASALLAASTLAGPAAGKIYYVDYQNGSDSADGLSPATAWQHAPGDTVAPAKILRLALQPGDQVRFRGGVRYRGSLLPITAGTPDNPVVFDGSAWGETRAIFDGSDSLSGARRCRSAAECLGAPNWKYLWRVDLPAGRSWTDYLFVGDEIYQVAQYPDLPLADSDDPAQYLPVPLAELSRLQSGQIRQALPADLGTGEPTLALWVNPNVIAFNRNVAVTANGVTFNPAGSWFGASFKPYTNRDSRFSLLNAPAMVNRAGQFAMSSREGIAIFWPKAQPKAGPGSAQLAVSVGGRRLGINTSKARNIVIRGFAFTSFSGEPGNMSQGAAILARGKLPGITITSNSFRAMAAVSGPAVIHTIFGQHLTIEHNDIQNITWGSGIIVDNSEGPTLVRCNSVSYLGRTGIRFVNVKDGQMLGNHVHHINGVHGNALTAYRDLRNILIAGNVVTDSIRPLTLEGVGNATPYFTEGTQSVTVTNNVLIGNKSVNGAVTSYNNTPNLTLTGNFLYSDPYAVKITGKEEGFTASGNQLVGGIVQPKDNKIFDTASNIAHDPAGNGAAMVQQMSNARPAAGYCS